MQNYSDGRIEEARSSLRAIKEVEGLSTENLKSIEIITEAIEILFLFSEENSMNTLNATKALLDKLTPEKLPQPDDQTADEFMFRVFEEFNRVIIYGSLPNVVVCAVKRTSNQ